MSQPLVPVVQGQVVTPSVVQPSAVAGARASAAYGLAQVLKDVIHGSPASFHGENHVLKAIEAVDKFVKAFVGAGELPALVTGDERALVENVALRTPPPQVTFGTPVNTGPSIDYDRLAAAIVRQQNAQAAAAAIDAAAQEEV
jgi:hypothetical protein